MCRKTMRPTNVRASVGSSASGSSASPMTSVPPFFTRGCVPRAPAATAVTRTSAARPAPRTHARGARFLLITLPRSCGSGWMQRCLSCGIRRTAHSRLDPICRQLDPKVVLSSLLMGDPASTSAPVAPAARLLDPQLVAIGVFGGVLSGLLGVGGGVIMVPLLVLWARYGQRDAHAASLGAIIPISIAGALTYGVAGRVHWAV